MGPGYAADDGAALHFVGTELVDVVSSRPGKGAHRVEVRGGDVVEERHRGAVPGRGARRAHRRMTVPTILALGGGGFTMETDTTALDDFVLTLAERREPRILFLPTASGDPREQIGRFHATFGDRAVRAAVLSLFRLATSTPAPARHRPVAGHRLRRRRLDAQPAGHLADARARRDPARGLASGASCWPA